MDSPRPLVIAILTVSFNIQYQDPGFSAKQGTKEVGYAQVPGSANDPARYQQVRVENCQLLSCVGVLCLLIVFLGCAGVDVEE